MGELIPRDWVLKNLLFDVDKDVVRAAPVVDAVLVVRCKDCVNFDDSIVSPYFEGYCERIDHCVEKNFFCGYAKMDAREEQQ